MTRELIRVPNGPVHVKVDYQRTLCKPDRIFRSPTASGPGDTAEVTCKRCQGVLSSIGELLVGIR